MKTLNKVIIEQVLFGQFAFVAALILWHVIGFFHLSFWTITLPLWLPWVLFLISCPMHYYYRLCLEILFRDATEEEQQKETTKKYHIEYILFALMVVGIFLLQIVPLLVILARKFF